MTVKTAKEEDVILHVDTRGLARATALRRPADW